MKKLDLKSLQRNCTPSNEWPDFLNIKHSNFEGNEQLEIQCYVPQNLKWFEGHYPDQAVLPGVVQVNWASELAQKNFTTDDFKGVNALKFNTMILPDTDLTLTLIKNAKSGSISFIYNNNDIRFSSGKIVFKALNNAV